MTADTVVVYHDPCMDGMAAAFAVKLAFPDAELVPAQYEKPLPFDKIEGKHAVFADISWPEYEMRKACLLAESVVILDHHESAIRKVGNITNHDPPENLYAVFDLERSGAGIAWDHFFNFSTRPAWISWVEDRDLWRFRFESTAPFNAFLRTVPKDFENYLWVHEQMKNESTGRRILAHGDEIRRLDRETVRVCAEQMEVAYWPLLQKRLRVVQAPSHLASEVGELLYRHESVDLAVVWDWREPDSLERKVSLRASKAAQARGVNCAKIAEQFGGGGHPGAAGFVCTRFPWVAGRSF